MREKNVSSEREDHRSRVDFSSFVPVAFGIQVQIRRHENISASLALFQCAALPLLLLSMREGGDEDDDDEG